MMRFLQTHWTAVAAGTLAYALTTWLCLQPQKQLDRAAAVLRATQTAKGGDEPGPLWTFQNPELTQLVASLKDEREALRVRASQLDELETRLNAERKEIYSITQTVYQLRTELDTTVTRVSEEETVNLKKLAKVYATMSPENAARILKEMDDDQVVKIFAFMKESESAPILENLGQGNRDEAKRVASISNRLRLTLATPKKTTTP